MLDAGDQDPSGAGERCPDGDGWTITFDRAAHQVVWSFDGSGWQVEQVRAELLVERLFGLLATVAWTSRTGGVIVGNNEAAAYDRAPGAGANYVVRRFGPVGARHR
jgi:hypothetical protein